MRWPRVPVLPALAVAAALGWAAALVAAPLTLPAGTVTGLGGAANRVDHLSVWVTLPPPQALVYGIGDLLCHQKAHRSLLLHGNQLPVDARMTGIFLAAVAGLAVAARPGLRRDAWFLGDNVLETVGWPAVLTPRARLHRAALALGAVGAALAPAALDVVAEAAFPYESTQPLRLVTGAVAGVAGGLTLGAGLRVVDTVLRTGFDRVRLRS